MTDHDRLQDALELIDNCVELIIVDVLIGHLGEPFKGSVELVQSVMTAVCHV